MLETAAQIPNGTTLEGDVCIIGAGAAGVSMALELMGKGLRVLLMEAGKEEEDPATQALYEGDVADARMHSPTDKYRHRRLGGSTAIWGGRCMPFDPIDFEQRDWVPNSGWPISYEDVAPFFPKANHYLEAGTYDYNGDTAFKPSVPPMFEGFESAKVRTNGLERFSCPTNMGMRYKDRLAAASDIRVVLMANCVGLRLRPDGTRVESADFASLDGRRFQVKAQCMVIATGGLEAARLLLASNDVQMSGIGNDHDVVGRYYMCHIAGNVGSMKINGPTTRVRHGYEVSPDGVYCRRRLHLSEDTQRQLRVSNMVSRLHFPKIIDPSHHNGVLSGLYLARHFISYEYGKRLRDGQQHGLALELKHIWNVITNPFDATSFATHWLRKRTLAERKFPSIILNNRTNQFSLEVHAEQIPRHDSRVLLTEKRDSLGMRRIKVDWRYSPEDIISVERTLQTIDDELRRTGLGRFDFDRATLEEDLLRFGAYGGHHVGTTRMGSDPRTSVVDSNSAVHGVANLFIASSSVFPTSSQANPTMMIVAQALRLTQHIQEVHRKSLSPQELAA
jgi:choline dehydrogenase-like flavoprotein